jgi:hypothetical protein
MNSPITVKNLRAPMAASFVSGHEEHTFLRFSHMQVTKQSLSHKDGHTYDIMVCQDMSNKEREVTAYFNVDIPTQSLKDALAN